MSDKKTETEKTKQNGIMGGGLMRTQGNIVPAVAYQETKPKKRAVMERPAHKVAAVAKKKATDAILKPKQSNSLKQVKLPVETKESILALKTITKSKFDYEVIEMLIDYYAEHALNKVERKRFDAIAGRPAANAGKPKK